MLQFSCTDGLGFGLGWLGLLGYWVDWWMTDMGFRDIGLMMDFVDLVGR